jgi:hypothetical protein
LGQRRDTGISWRRGSLTLELEQRLLDADGGEEHEVRRAEGAHGLQGVERGAVVNTPRVLHPAAAAREAADRGVDGAVVGEVGKEGVRLGDVGEDDVGRGEVRDDVLLEFLPRMPLRGRATARTRCPRRSSSRTT